MDRDSFIDDALTSYIETALWSSLTDQGEPLDDLYDASDLSDETEDDMMMDVADFVISNWETVQDFSPRQIGHDFWLTRNHHGAGFWDGGYPDDIGSTLTKASHVYSESSLWVSDNGRIELD